MTSCTNDEKTNFDHVEVTKASPSGLTVDTIDLDHLAEASDYADAVRKATEREHALSFREAARAYPWALFWSIAISFTIIMDGYDTYLLSQFYAYPSFAKKYGEFNPAQNDYNVPASTMVMLANLNMFGSCIGLFGMSLFTERFGHRMVIMMGLVALVATNFLTFFAPNIKWLTAGVCLSGIPQGLFGILGSAYASEVAPLALRGFLTSFVNICWVIGQFVAGGLLAGLVNIPSEWSFRIPFGLQWVWCIPVFFLTLWAPDSPWWCIRKGNMAGAERSFKKLSPKSTHSETRDLLAMYQHTTTMETAERVGTSVLDCFKGVDLRRTEIACMVLAAQPLSGELFAYGSTYFFRQAGLSATDTYKLNFGSTAVAFVGTVLSWILAIWFGRRTLIIAGFVLMALELLLVGILHYFNSSQSVVWTQAALTVLWLGTYSATLGPQSFGLAAEVSATKLRAPTIALARLWYTICCIIGVSFQPYLINATALDLKGRTGFVWFGFCILTLIWCIFRLPETKGLTYAELDILFERRTPAWKFKSAKVDVIEESARDAGSDSA
ncbi:hypothetical protein VHUM_04186 [Vanrija humicola]|uniref:Major facilitator superfamily (MFS) profile domain-containing protein n=1 Tax=Vanrija humicola TaxID=5417 RepID=A0A7D8UVM3_VANHU|nr:hypothetical protein VHUM_04186 [Vanrija humicola]